MDGMMQPSIVTQPMRQRTLAAGIGCVGIGLHSAARIQLELIPAAPGTGVVFRRSDLHVDIAAVYDNVGDTRLCTVLVDHSDPTVRIGTIEHVMAAISACRIDNVIVAVDGPEIPVLDGSAEQFMFLIACAGVVEQDAPPRIIEILKTVRVTDGQAFAELRPTIAGVDFAVSIDFAAAAIGRQAFSMRMTEAAFRSELASARTFAMADDIAGLQKAGLARGGSLSNAVVVDGDRVLNPGGLRMSDEFVRHKMLDAVGDMALVGGRLKGRYVAHRPGHSLNNRLLRTLFADSNAWTWADAPAFTGWSGVPMAAAAAPV